MTNAINIFCGKVTTFKVILYITSKKYKYFIFLQRNTLYFSIRYIHISNNNNKEPNVYIVDNELSYPKKNTIQSDGNSKWIHQEKLK